MLTPVMNDKDWWDMIAREAIAKGRDRPVAWRVEYEDGADGCLPLGWYLTGLDARGERIDWPVSHLYGPFDTEAEAMAYSLLVNQTYITQENDHDSRPLLLAATGSSLAAAAAGHPRHPLRRYRAGVCAVVPA